MAALGLMACGKDIGLELLDLSVTSCAGDSNTIEAVTTENNSKVTEVENQSSINSSRGRQIDYVDETENNVIANGYPCTMCNRIFSTSKKLTDHKYQVHCPRQQCEICQQTFSSKRNLLRHLDNKHKIRESSSMCDQCGKSFMRRDNLKTHQEICLLRGENKKPEVKEKSKTKYDCRFCNQTYSYNSSLRRHMNNKHILKTKEGSYMFVSRVISKYKSVINNTTENICKMCPILRRFSSRCNLKRHTDKFHKNNTDNIQFGLSFLKLSSEKLEERMMKCHICNQEFTCIQNLRKHNIDTHGIMKSFSCNICHKVFNKKNQLMSHRYEVHRGRIFSCGYCNKSFKRLGHLISHKYRIHNTAKKEKTATEIS